MDDDKLSGNADFNQVRKSLGRDTGAEDRGNVEQRHRRNAKRYSHFDYL